MRAAVAAIDNSGAAQLVTKSEGEYSVRITDSESNEEVQIDRKDCNEAHKPLGHLKLHRVTTNQR